MRFLYLQILSLLFITLPGSSAADDFQLDGEFGDWKQSHEVAADRLGDATGAFDISRVFGWMDNATLWVKFDITNRLNLASGLESDGTLRLLLDLPDERKLSIDFRKRLALLQNEQSSSTLTWSHLRFAALPTHASKEFELCIDLSILDVRPGDKIKLTFEGSDTLDKSIVIENRVRDESGIPDAQDVSARTGAVIVVDENGELTDINGSPFQSDDSLYARLRQMLTAKHRIIFTSVLAGKLPCRPLRVFSKNLAEPFRITALPPRLKGQS